ncbi:hypothetical protein SUGI_0284030 [Cryptomeria japonica]|nr:hypothetical protein SUGI_0284030 [Cryptomeria japonica]
MEILGKKRKGGVSWAELEENCISTILSFTTVKDVCSLAAVCSSWRFAADTNLVWERMITLQFGQNISKAISSLAFPSNN